MEIKKYTRETEGFYALMGPFFGSRAIEAELGAKVYDDAGRIWFIAVEGESVLGFVSYVPGKTAWVKSCYVPPEHRKNGIFSKLLKHCIAEAKAHGDKLLKCVATEASSKGFAKQGFVATGKRGSYTVMELQLK